MSDLNGRLIRLTSIRVLVVVSITVPYILFYPDQMGEPPLKFLIGFTSIQTLVYVALLRILRPWPKTQAYIQFVGDLLLITLLIYQLDAAKVDAANNFSIFYVFVIAVSSLFVHRGGVLAVAGLAYLLYGAVTLGYLGYLFDPSVGWPSLPEHPAAAFQLTYNLIMHFVGFYGVAILTAYLVRSAERSAERLRKTHLDLSYLQGLHTDVIQSMSSGLAITDLDGFILSLNPSGEEILAFPQNKLLGRHLCETGIFGKEIWTPFSEGSEESRLRSESECRRGNGEMVCIGYTLTRLRDGEGKHHGYTLIFQDLTEWRQLQEQVRMQDRMAAIGQLAAGLAHEVGNPLAAISGSVEMLARSMHGTGAQHKLLEITLKESRRLDRTVKGFLQFAKPMARRPVDFDIAMLLAEDVQLLKNSKDVLSEHTIEADLIPISAQVCADLDQVGQIFWNLARNALQAMPDGGRLTVIGRQQGEKYRMQFRDTGRGMTEEERGRLFHPFKSFFDQGTGLGMAIVYRIVEEHAGEIHVQSEPGEGTTITVDLPVKPPIQSLKREDVA